MITFDNGGGGGGGGGGMEEGGFPLFYEFSQNFARFL